MRTLFFLIGERQSIESRVLVFSISLLSSPEKPIMRLLDARLGDREAQEFVRRLKEIEKSMEEE